MNVNAMMSMIDKKVGNDKDKARQKEIETKNRFDIALAKIKELKPRIDDLIKLANYAKDNGINFDKRDGVDMRDMILVCSTQTVGHIL